MDPDHRHTLCTHHTCHSLYRDLFWRSTTRLEESYTRISHLYALTVCSLDAVCSLEVYAQHSIRIIARGVDYSQEPTEA